MVERLEWTGPTLYDICTKRLLSAAGAEAKVKKLTDLFEPDVYPGRPDRRARPDAPAPATPSTLYQVFLSTAKTRPTTWPGSPCPSWCWSRSASSRASGSRNLIAA
ncbi:MAG: hypothetical protein U1G05_10715 [Kiritimatiellia bacterium]